MTSHRDVIVVFKARFFRTGRPLIIPNNLRGVWGKDLVERAYFPKK